MPSPLASQRIQSSPISQRKYCTGQGSLTPSFNASLAFCAGVTLGSRLSVRIGFPERDINKYDRIVMPKKIGIACNRRRAIYRDIELAYPDNNKISVRYGRIVDTPLRKT